MLKLRQSRLGIVVFIFTMLSNPTLAIDNPDSSDLIAEFEASEKPFIAAIENPDNSTRGYAVSYTNYLEFLDRELNTVYKTLYAKLPTDKQTQLKASQISWLKYRDQEWSFVENTWTKSDFGSSSSISRGQYKASIVRDRTIQLMHYAKTF